MSVRSKNQKRATQVLPRDLTLEEGMRELLARQCEAIAASAPLAALGEVEALHDLRIALRRSRTLLRVFREHLPGSQGLAEALGDINRRLGRLRDLDTWIAFLEKTGKKHPRIAATVGGAMIRHAIERRIAELPKAQRDLRGRTFKAAERTFARLIASIGSKRPGVADELFEVVIANQLRRRIHKARSNRDWRQGEDRKTIHRARNRFRQVRYLAELTTAVLGASASRAAQCLHAVEQALGRAHDMDCAAEFLEATFLPPAKLQRLVARRRSKALQRARETAQQTEWQKLEARLKQHARGQLRKQWRPPEGSRSRKNNSIALTQ